MTTTIEETHIETIHDNDSLPRSEHDLSLHISSSNDRWAYRLVDHISDPLRQTLSHVCRGHRGPSDTVTALEALLMGIAAALGTLGQGHIIGLVAARHNLSGREAQTQMGKLKPKLKIVVDDEETAALGRLLSHSEDSVRIPRMFHGSGQELVERLRAALRPFRVAWKTA